MVKRVKKDVLSHFSELGLLDRLDMHIVRVLNVFQHLATLPSHGGLLKNHKIAVLSDPKSQKIGLAMSRSLKSK